MGDWENNKDIQLMRLHTTQDDEVLIIAFNEYDLSFRDICLFEKKDM